MHFSPLESVFLSAFFVCRIWFWVAAASPSSPRAFQWPRDSIYGAIVLLGAGGAIVHVMSMTMAAYVIGPYAVRGGGREERGEVGDICTFLCILVAGQWCIRVWLGGVC